MKEPRVDVEIFVQPFCGDAPCADDAGEGANALITKRVRVNGFDLPFSKASLKMDGSDIVGVTVEFFPGRLKVISAVDPWDPEL